MNAYPRRDRGTVFADQDSMTAMLFFLERKIITVTEHTYPYDQDITINHPRQGRIITDALRPIPSEP